MFLASLNVNTPLLGLGYKLNEFSVVTILLTGTVISKLFSVVLVIIGAL
jgi:hypothetical protein